MNLLLITADCLSDLEAKGNVDSLRNHHNPNDMFDNIYILEPPSTTRGSERIGDDMILHHTYVPKTDGFTGRFFRLFGYLLVLWKALRLIRRGEVDVMRGQGPFRAALVCVLAQKITGHPGIVALHNDYDRQQQVEGSYNVLGLKWVTKLTERYTISRASHVFALTSYLREYALWHGADEEDIHVLPTHTNTQEFEPPEVEVLETTRSRFDIEPGDFTLVFVGRLVGQKDPHTLLEGYRRAKADLPNLRLIIIGDGPLRKGLERKIETEDISGVQFTGFVDRSEVGNVMAASDALVQPTLCEGLGYVFMEAHASGLPVVTTDIPHTKDIVNRGNAFVFDIRDPGDLADCLRRAQDEEACRKRIERARETVQRFDSAYQHDRAEAVFRKIAADKASG